VRLVAYESLGRSRRGVVSSALAELTGEAATAAVYPHRNPAFRLPDDPDAPIIMVGPGTGVAPFRAFLADREAVGARGRNWLFFGDRSFRHDFLYQTEWLAWRKKGLLRLDVAFSRDTDRKIYVQHRLQEHGAEIYSWLENGAHLYVCGDAQHMAPDVERTLLGMIEQHGARSRELAAEYLLELQRSRRYQKDVY
jgi:sulfite reductase (NADPH) flavoprotein alpha-component